MLLQDELDSGHALAGPIEVRGARAGQTLVVRIDDVRPGSWGFTSTHEHRILWELADGVGRGGGACAGFSSPSIRFLSDRRVSREIAFRVSMSPCAHEETNASTKRSSSKP